MSTDTGGVANTDTGSDVGDGPGGSTRNDIVEDLDEDADDDAEEEGVNTDDVDADEVDAEDREDRIADRILADLKDGKKDSKKKDKDDDEDADEDGVDQSTDQDADSGDVDQDANVINTGDNVNQCVAILQVANTGNAQNANGIVQSDSEADDIELEDGSTIDITPRLVVECRQVIRQVVRAERLKGPGSKFRTSQIRAGGAPIVRTGAQGRVGAGAVVPTSRLGAAAAPKVLSASRAGQPKTSTLKSLPRTGGFSGYATLLGLGAGTLLVGDGLLVRRLAR